MKIDIKKAVYGDSDMIFEVFSKARKEMSYLPQIHTEDETKNFIKNLCQKNTYKALVDGRVVGFINIENNFLNHLYILPGSQNMGIGKRLLDFAKEVSLQGLNLWVFEKNKDAIKFYEREGFKLIQKRDKKMADNEEKLPDRKYFWPKS